MSCNMIWHVETYNVVDRWSEISYELTPRPVLKEKILISLSLRITIHTYSRYDSSIKRKHCNIKDTSHTYIFFLPIRKRFRSVEQMFLPTCRGASPTWISIDERDHMFEVIRQDVRSICKSLGNDRDSIWISLFTRDVQLNEGFACAGNSRQCRHS